MSVYRFPALVVDEDCNLKTQINKVKSELAEAKRAEITYRCAGRGKIHKTALGVELLDIIHAVETALRMEFDDAEVEELRAKVIEKNGRRGYYGTVD